MAWQRAAGADEVAEGLPLGVSVAGYDICLLKWHGNVYAIDDICSHAEAQLSQGEQDGPILQCPRHGGRFDIRTGKAVHYPAFSPVATYPTRVEDGIVFVDVAP